MKRLAVIGGALVAVLIVALVVAPSFIDWTSYRTEFESRLAAATGRDVSIDGTVSLTLLPRPAFEVGGVSIANPPGASTETFVAAESVAVNLAFGPLLAGRLQFTSIEIIAPVVNAEVLGDGTTTWTFTPGNDSATAAEPSEDASFDLGIDSLVIERGTLRYADAQTGSEQTVVNLNMELAVGSASGPFDIAGDLTVLGQDVSLTGTMGEMRDDRPVAVSLSLADEATGATAAFAGSVTLTSGSPSANGRVTVSGESLSTVFAGFDVIAPGQSLPQALGQAFSAEAKIESGGTGLDADDLALKLGTTTFSGAAQIDWTGDLRFALNLTAARLNLEEWQMGQAKPPTRFATAPAALIIGPAAAQTVDDAFVLPTGLGGTVDLGITLVEWRGQVMRNARFSASLDNGELTVLESGIEMPGNTALVLSGFIRARGGEPDIDMNGELTSRDFRTLLGWLDVAPPADVVPPSRLNSLSVATNVTGSPSKISFQDLAIMLDTTRLTGTAQFDMTESLKSSLDLSVSNFDLDSYVPAIRERLSAGAAAPAASAAPATTTAAAPDYSALTTLNADLNVRAGSVTAGGNTFSTVVLNISADKGTITVRNASVGDIAGATVSASGVVKATATALRADPLNVAIESSDLGRTARTLNVDLPRLPLLQGPVAARSTLSGTTEAIELQSKITLGVLQVETNGSVASLSTTPKINLNATAQHPAYYDLLRALGWAVDASVPPVGAMSARAQVSGTAQSVRLSNASLQAGGNVIQATLDLATADQGARVSGTVSMADVDLDQLVPPDPTEELARTSRSRASRRPAEVSGRWTTDSIDLSGLQNMDMTVTVTAERLRARGLDIDALNAPVRISAGRLSVQGWKGNLYGGPATGNIAVVFGPPIEFQAAMAATGADLDRLGGAEKGSASGKVDIQAQLAAAGVSQLDLVSSLAGQGTLTATGLDASKRGQGLAFTTLVAPVRAVSQLGGLLSGGVTKGLATMRSDFSVQQGVVTLSNATLQSNVYSGEFAGQVDLPRWWMDIEGRVRLEANLITQLLGNRVQLPSLIPVAIQGPIDLPNVNVQTAPAGTQQQATPSATAEPTTPTQPQQPNPAQLFQGIFNELTKPR